MISMNVFIAAIRTVSRKAIARRFVQIITMVSFFFIDEHDCGRILL